MPRLLGCRLPTPRTALFAAAAGIAVAIALGSATVLATAVYDHSTPTPGAVLQSSPARIDIWTKHATVTDPSLTQMVITDANNHHVEADLATVDPADHSHFWVDVQPNLAPGRYLVWYKTQGAQDFDRDGGTYAFYVGAPPSSADLKADKLLPLTTVDGGAAAISGLERGVVEGGVPLFIAAVGFYIYWQKRRGERHAGDAETPDRIDLPRR